jgi:hypothetical protein
MTLFRAIGGTIGVTVLGAIVNSRMVAELGNNLPAGAIATLPTTDVNSIGGLLMSPLASSIPTPVLEAIRLSLSNSITYMFLIGAGIVIFGLLTSVFIRNVSLKTADEYHERVVPQKESAQSNPGQDGIVPEIMLVQEPAGK